MAVDDPNFGVVFPTRFSDQNSTFACALGSLANDQPADHWALRLPPLQKIGIMEPKYGAGENPAFDDYLSQADWGALDVIGWNISRPVAAVVPQRPNSLTPISGASLVSKTPALSWSAFGDTASVFVHAGTQHTATSEKWRASGVTTNTATPPAGILQGGATYMWFVTAFNSEGFAVTARSTFTTKCDADVDDGNGAGTPDGGVTIDDLVYYIDVYTGGGAAADVDDGSGLGIPDSGVTIDDLVYYLDHFDGGC